MRVPAPAGVLTENETHMGRFPKALVMTLLIMEITAIVALTTVWTSLSELHASQVIINIALGLSVVGLGALAVMVFRRAMAAERRLESSVDLDLVAAVELFPEPASARPALNAIGSVTGPNLSGGVLLAVGQPVVHRVE